MSKAEDTLALHLRTDGIPHSREYSAIPGRKFRYDFYCHTSGMATYTGKSVLVEVQGGVWLKGKSAHSSGIGLTRDAEKLSLAAVNGLRVIVCTPAQIKSGKAIEWIKQALK